MSTNNQYHLPELKFNKNGHEIRSDILSLAAQIVRDEHASRLSNFQLAQESGPAPEYPGIERVLLVAEQLYTFVSQTSKK